MQSGQVLTLIERFGAAPPRAYRGAYAGQNPDNRNALALMDLDLVDPNTLDPTDASAIANAVSASPKSVRTVAINNAPNLFEVPIDDSDLLNRAEDLRGNHDLQTALGNALAERFADRSEPDQVEQKIYAGFYPTDDKKRLKQFQFASWAKRIEIAQAFEDRRLQWLASRLIYLNEPSLLSRSAQDYWKDAIDQRWQSDDPNPEWTTIEHASRQLAEITDQGVLSIHDLQALKEYYSSLGTSE